ncbi:MAG: nucleotidyltransferase family protein [Chloroflexota bacterium]|nr:nucleotidyltransferase family protein [Chloroflexota bacterium]
MPGDSEVAREAMQVAILAGGLATRLGEVARGRPKSMVPVVGRPFLEYQLDMLRRNGVGDIVLCTGHLGEQIEEHFGDGSRFGVSIEYSREERPLGTAGALAHARDLLGEVFFTLYGDSYLFLDFGAAIAHLRSRGGLALMSVYRNCDRYERSNTAVAGGMVSGYSKDERQGDMLYIEYGANVFRREVLDMIPAAGRYSLEELFPRLIARGELLAYEVEERFYEIGSPQGLADFERFVARGRP